MNDTKAESDSASSDAIELTDLNLRLAQPDDVPFVAKIVREVSDGIIDYLLSAVPGMSAESILQLAFDKGVGAYSLSNVLLFEVHSQTAGLCFAYDAQQQSVPKLMETFLSAEKVEGLRPLLEAKVENALWINTFWVSPAFRGSGLSGLLMSLAADMARDRGFSSVALHCWADNARALRFYEHAGFAIKGQIPTAPALEARHPQGGLLLVKPVAAAV